jgi:hypothetical protein
MEAQAEDKVSNADGIAEALVLNPATVVVLLVASKPVITSKFRSVVASKFGPS